jgi:hypothetical protein
MCYFALKMEFPSCKEGMCITVGATYGQKNNTSVESRRDSTLLTVG